MQTYLQEKINTEMTKNITLLQLENETTRKQLQLEIKMILN